MSATEPLRADADRLVAALDGAAWRVVAEHGDVIVDVEPARIVDAVAAAEAEGYDFLVDIAATDHHGFGGDVGGYWSGPAGLSRRDMNAQQGAAAGLGVVPQRLGPKRFSLSYTLLGRALDPPRRLRLRIWVDEDQPVPTLVGLCPGADYSEREAFDMMGIPFAGHPNLERIFMAEGWEGHPHRKTYPIGGEPVQFSDAR